MTVEQSPHPNPAADLSKVSTAADAEPVPYQGAAKPSSPAQATVSKDMHMTEPGGEAHDKRARITLPSAATTLGVLLALASLVVSIFALVMSQARESAQLVGVAAIDDAGWDVPEIPGAPSAWCLQRVRISNIGGAPASVVGIGFTVRYGQQLLSGDDRMHSSAYTGRSTRRLSSRSAR